MRREVELKKAQPAQRWQGGEGGGQRLGGAINREGKEHARGYRRGWNN